MEMKEPMSALAESTVPRPIPDSPFLSRGDVARLFGVSLSTVTRWARMGLLPVVRTPGGHYRYRADEVRRAVASGLLGSSQIE